MPDTVAASPIPPALAPAGVTPLLDLHDLRQVVVRAFPGRSELATLRLDGPRASAWEVCARTLGLDASTLARHLAPVYGVEVAGSLEHIAASTLALVPANFCHTQGVLPLRLEEGHLVMATSDPADDNVRERARFMANRPIRWVLAAPQAIEDATSIAIAMEAQRQSVQRLGDVALDENAVVKLVRALVTQAIDARASDLHIQPFLGAFAVRMRVDGHLRRMTMLPDAVATAVIRHCKARSGMDPTNHQVPQDGRMSLVHGDREFDLRVSTLPASRGDRLVLRFLDQSRVHALTGAGFSIAALQALRRAVKRPSGMVILTGPTGCGKTSTLYGLLSELNRSSVNIITVENPVEYRLPGVSQVDVNDRAGRSFAAALRSILRQDPDIVLVGEIRDAETADIAAQAALTGHLVLSTLHTNDAMTAIPRLLNLGVAPSILADSLATVVAQRLCRVLCPHCRQPATDPLSPMERAFLTVSRNRPAYRAIGCEQCDMTGYRGRLPIVEVVELDRRLRDAIAAGETRLDVLEGLREGGLKSLAASGSLRVISGDTTVAEVVEAVGPGFWRELSAHYGHTGATGIEALDDHHDHAGHAVLFIGDDAAVAAQVGVAVAAEDLRLVQVRDAEAAHAALVADEDIAYIVGDVPDSQTLDQTLAQLSHNRLHISWARLPAVVLLPPTLMARQAELVDGGVMGSFLPKPVSPTDLAAFVRRARAR